MEGLVFRGWGEKMSTTAHTFMKRTLPTSPKHCLVYGPGIGTCIARELTTFVIESYDAEGTKQESDERCSKDDFAVHVRMVRGGAQLLCRIVPHGNGSYTVGFKPILSGKYIVTITLGGEPVKDSPYHCTVAPPRPESGQCLIQGNALTKALAREPQHFEVSFRDALGNLTHAEELDVYALPEEEVDEISFRAPSPRRDADSRDDTKAAKKTVAAEKASTAEAAALAGNKSGKAVGRAAQQKRSSRMSNDGAPEPSAPAAAPEAALELENEFVEGKMQRQCVITSRKPLIVREGRELDSPMVRKLPAGVRLTIFELEGTDEGDLRAFIALSDPPADPEAELEVVPACFTLDNTYEVGALCRPTPRLLPRTSLTAPTPLGPVAPERSSESIASEKPLRSLSVFAAAEPRRAPSPTSYMSASGTGTGAKGSMSARGGSMSARGGSMSARSGGSMSARSGTFGSASARASVNATGGSLAGAVPVGARAPRTPRPLELFPIGWVTIAKKGTYTVAPRTELPAPKRQEALTQWLRRQTVDAVDKLAQRREVASEGSKFAEAYKPCVRHAQEVFQTQESGMVKDGVGFAYGGIEPGRLGVRGDPVSWHKVYYSVAKAGRYKLHVGLRQQGVALPGSPFILHVDSGTAHPLACCVPCEALPLCGVVGLESEHSGCKLWLPTFDRMKNACTRGGASIESAVVLDCVDADDASEVTALPDAAQRDATKIPKKELESLAFKVSDRADGSYLLEWRAKKAGRYKVRVTVNHVDIPGSPLELQLIGNFPNLASARVCGSMLQGTLVCGQPAFTLLSFRDEYGNPVQPSKSGFRLGMAMLPAAEAVRERASKGLDKGTTAAAKKELDEACKKDKENAMELWRTAPPYLSEADYTDAYLTAAAAAVASGGALSPKTAARRAAEAGTQPAERRIPSANLKTPEEVVPPRASVEAAPRERSVSEDAGASSRDVMSRKQQLHPRSVFARSNLFVGLTEDQLDAITSAMQPMDAPAGSVIYSMGDSGDKYYIVESGEFHAFVLPAAKLTDSELPMKQYMEGDSFGETALMYNAPCAVTVTTAQAGRLWTVSRSVYRQVQLHYTSKKKQKLSCNARLRYVAETAGEMDMHVWAQQRPIQSGDESWGERKAVPGSPFRVRCLPGSPHAPASSVGTLQKQEKGYEREGKKSDGKPDATPHGKKKSGGGRGGHELESMSNLRGGEHAWSSVRAASGKWTLTAGETLVVRPVLRDRYGNLAHVTNGSLTVKLALPKKASAEPEGVPVDLGTDGGGVSPVDAEALAGRASGAAPDDWIDLEPVAQTKSGLSHSGASASACDIINYEAFVKGTYRMHILLDGVELGDSPLIFECVPADPCATRSRIALPPEPLPYIVGEPYTITACLVDRFGNDLNKGGFHATAHIKSASNTPLPPGQVTAMEMHDGGDGTFSVQINLRGPADLKMVIALHLKEIQQSEGDRKGKVKESVFELAPVSLSFVASREEESFSREDAPKAGRNARANHRSTAVLTAVHRPSGDEGEVPSGWGKEMSAFRSALTRGLEVTAEAASVNEPVVTAENTLETAPAATAPSSARASSSASAPASAPAPAPAPAPASTPASAPPPASGTPRLSTSAPRLMPRLDPGFAREVALATSSSMSRGIPRQGASTPRVSGSTPRTVAGMSHVGSATPRQGSSSCAATPRAEAPRPITPQSSRSNTPRAQRAVGTKASHSNAKPSTLTSAIEKSMVALSTSSDTKAATATAMSANELKASMVPLSREQLEALVVAHEKAAAAEEAVGHAPLPLAARFAAVLEAKNLKPADIVKSMDWNRDSRISKMEFRAGIHKLCGHDIGNAEIDQLFLKIDVDASGSLDEAELKAALKGELASRPLVEAESTRAEAQERGRHWRARAELARAAIVAIEAIHTAEAKLEEHRLNKSLRVRMAEALHKAKMSKNYLGVAMFFDTSEDGIVSLAEFHKGVLTLLPQTLPEESAALFAEFDGDQSGSIDMNEFKVANKDISATTASAAAEEAKMVKAIEKLKKMAKRSQADVQLAKMEDEAAQEEALRASKASDQERMAAKDQARRAAEAAREAQNAKREAERKAFETKVASRRTIAPPPMPPSNAR